MLPMLALQSDPIPCCYRQPHELNLFLAAEHRSCCRAVILQTVMLQIVMLQLVVLQPIMLQSPLRFYQLGEKTMVY